MPGLVVLRSLTKTWGLAGLRAGYAVGDPAVIARLRGQQPPWSVSTPALAAIAACLSDKAREIADGGRRGDRRAPRRTWSQRLAERGLPAAGRPRSPVRPGRHRAGPTEPPAGSARPCATEGFAVRRGETFPGLGPDWIRIAVRDPARPDRLAAALRPGPRR